MYYKVQAYFYKDGEYKLQEYASGFAHKQARDYFNRLYDTNQFAKVTMTRLETSPNTSINNQVS